MENEIRRGKCGPKIKDLRGKTFGGYKVIEFYAGKRNPAWVCECKCGNRVIIATQELKQRNRQSCVKCRKIMFGEIHCRYLSHLQVRARRKKIEYDVSGEYLWKLYQNQSGKCAYTGRNITFANDYRNKWQDQTASLDRIDSTKGYVEGNVQWVHKKVNAMKWEYSDQEFLQVCRDVVNHKKL